MPEGDTIYRAAAMMNRALAGTVVRAFDSPLPLLERFAENRHLVGRTIDAVEARGKYLLVRFAGGLTLLTHMRMSGTWHLYRHGERWRARRADMRARIVTDDWEAVAFNLPVAEFHDERSLARSPRLQALGPDPLSTGFDVADAVARLRAAGDLPIEEVLLDQRRLAGIGNVLKSETLFVARTYPYTPVSALDDAALRAIVHAAQQLLTINVAAVDRPAAGRRPVGRNTTRSMDPGSALYVYGRAGKPCRRCGSAIRSRRAGQHARSTYWCPACQNPAGTTESAGRRRS